MEIKSVGLERNIQITELKGYDVMCYEGFHPTQIKIPNKAYKSTMPHWSTNRNDAWELWDELPKLKYYREFTETEKGMLHPEDMCIVMVGTMSYIGKDFADCVSQAWLTWKGNQ